MATRKYTSRHTVTRELSDDAKIAKIEAFAGKEVTNKLVELYGPYAYDIYEKAFTAPAHLMAYTDGNFRDSKASLSYLAEHELSNKQLAQLFNTTETAVEAKKASYRVEHQADTRDEATPSTATAERSFDNRVDSRTGSSTGSSQQSAQETTPDAEDAPEMTLDDYVKYYKKEDRPLKGQAFKDAAYKDFGKGEGVSSKIYVEWQNDGNPTIGKGNLIFPKILLDPKASKKQKDKAGTLSGYKQRFREMELTKVVNGRTVTLTIAEKDKIFDDLVAAVKNKTLKTRNENGYNVVISPASAAQVRMSEAGMRKQFDKDIDAVLQRTYKGLGKGNPTKGKEIFDKYPKDLQLALAHAYYVGNPGANITQAIQKGEVNPQDPVQVLTKLSQVRYVGDEKTLQKLERLNPEVFNPAKQSQMKQQYTKNRKNAAPVYDARQIGKVADSLSVAQNRYQENYLKKQQPYRVADASNGR